MKQFNVEAGLATTNKLFSYSVIQLFSYSIILLIFFSCGRSYPPQQPVSRNTVDVERLISEALVQVNRELIEEEGQKIKDYVESQNWDMQTSETGLWYMIYGNGKGEKASIGNSVTLNYTLSLMDGTICYSSDEYGQKTFVIGYSDDESGLHEGVQLMQVGNKARMIMPAHLAYRILGDGDCIPGGSIIIYDVELLSIKN